MNKLIEISSLSKSFNNVILFENISFTIFDKGFYGLVGDSGTGKTTFLLILGLIDTSYNGDIYFNNINYKCIKNKELFIFNNIGFIFQNPVIFPDLTLFENLSLYNKTNDRLINKLLIKLDLFSKKNILAKKLSGGERMRLSLIRGLMNNPKILILDELTASLDLKTSSLIMDFLKEESKKRTIFMVSHNIKLLNKYTDVLYILKNNCIKKVLKYEKRS